LTRLDHLGIGRMGEAPHLTADRSLSLGQGFDALVDPGMRFVAHETSPFPPHRPEKHQNAMLSPGSSVG
jgi:hypothetical protein